MQFKGFFFIRKWKLFTCTLLLHDGLSPHFSDSCIMTLLTSFIYKIMIKNAINWYIFSLRQWELFTCTLLFHDGLHDHFSDSFVMALLTSFICRYYDKIKCNFNRCIFLIMEIEITLPVHCCSMMVSVTISVIVSSWHSWRVLSAEIMIN